MTYTSGGLIEATDYNGFASTTSGANVNNVWGAGSGDSGWGQPTTLSTVSVTNTVTATQWSDLNNRISSMGSQTGTSMSEQGKWINYSGERSAGALSDWGLGLLPNEVSVLSQ